MKRIIKKYQPEDAKFFCDKHSHRECFSKLEINSWYGSVFDLDRVEVHLCDVCVKEMYELLKKDFGSVPIQTLI